MRIFSIVFICVFFFKVADAQLTKVLHQTFEIDSVDKVILNLVGEYELEKWAGNNILTETKIEIYDAKPGVFKYLVEEKKRYEIVAEIDNMTASLFSNDSKRAAIKNNETGKECYEFIKVKIFVPEDFNIEDPVNLVRMTIAADPNNE